MTIKPQIDVNFAEGVECNQETILFNLDQSVEMAIKVGKLDFASNAELSILIGNDEILQKLNHEWRNKDQSTNVLSFPTHVLKLGKIAGPMLGDIAISLETAQREAALEMKSFEHHFNHLVVHGFLHLFGYDHETDEEANLMEGLETRILKQLGIADPYQV